MGDPALVPKEEPKKPARVGKAPILSSVPPTVQEEPKERPMTLGGFAENALDDTWEFAKGLFNILPATVKSYQQNVPYIWKNLNALTPEMLWSFDSKGGDKDQIIKGQFKGAIPETLKGILDATTENYKKHGLRVGYEKPFSTVADAFTLATVGVSQVRNVGKIAKAMGAGEKAERLIRAADKMEHFLATAPRKAVDSGVKAVTGHDLSKERLFKHIKQDERGAEMLKLQDMAQENFEKYIDKLTTAEEQALFHKARVFGDTPYGVSEEILNANPKVKAALEAYAPLEKYSKDTALKWNRVTPEVMDETLAKKYSLEAFGDISKANVEKAAQIINDARAAGKRVPMYGPNVFTGKGAKEFAVDDLLDDMMTGGKTVREGKVGAYEVMKGAKGYTTDPRIYARQMVKTTADVEAKSRMMDRLLRERDLITAPEGKAAKGFNPSESIPEGVHRKYYEDTIRAEALKAITDPTVKRLLRWEYTGKQSAMLQLYDKFWRLFAKMATRWNPKWVPGNIVGDSFIGALFGSDWDAARALIKKRQMPADFMTGKVAYTPEEALQKRGVIDGALERYGDIAGQFDTATRAGVVHRHVATKLKSVSADVQSFSESIGDVLSSTQRFSDVQVGLQRIEENVARSSVTVRARDKELAVLQQREQALASKLEATDLQKQLANREKMEAQKGKIADAWRSTAEQYPKHVYGLESQERHIKEATQGAIKKAQRIESESILGAAGQKGFEKGMRVLDQIRQKIVNKTAERNAIVRDIMDDLIKQGELEKLVPGLREQVNIVREGAERANAVLPSWNAMNGFEQRVMGRIIPFYPFAKTMAMLAFRIPFLAPVKSFAWNRLQEFLTSMTEDPRTQEYTKGRIPIHVTEDGKVLWWKLTTYSPFEGLKTSRPGGIPVPGMLDPLRQPVIALGYKFLGGKTVFDFGLPYGQQVVSIGDGAVDRFMPNGLLKREIEPTPLVSGVMHMFPLTQLAEAVLAPSRMNKYDWIGYPHPIMNPDGSYKAPKELMERIGALLGMNLQRRSKEEIIRSDKIESMKAFRALRKMWPTADAEEREMIRNAFEDRNRGMYRQRDR